MTSQELRPKIIAALGTQELTIDQLLAQLLADGAVSPKLQRARLGDNLRSMYRAGELRRERDAGGEARYSMPLPRYRWRDRLDVSVVERRAYWSSTGERWLVIGDDMTRGEARACVAALNEMDRRERAEAAGR